MQLGRVLLVGTIALSACSQDLGLDRVAFACATTNDCVLGQVCAPSPVHGGRLTCMAIADLPDDGKGDTLADAITAPDEGADLGPDAEPDVTAPDVADEDVPAECETAGDCLERLGKDRDCNLASCDGGRCLVTPKASPTCDDLDPCTFGEVCVEGACVIAETETCSTGLACRVGTCTGVEANRCSYATAPGWCFRSGACFEDGAVDPDDACAACDGTSQTFGPVTGGGCGDEADAGGSDATGCGDDACGADAE